VERRLVAMLDDLVADWSRERPDLDLSHKQVVYALYIVATLLTRNADAVLAPWKLNFNSFGVLATLRRGGAPFERASGELAEALGFTAGGMSNLLLRLEKLGYVTRARSATDARGVRVRLSAAGRRVVDEALKAVARSEARHIGSVGAVERRRLYRGLRTLIDSFADG
jgi:DNA-binding MarR family transcriptional regulator